MKKISKVIAFCLVCVMLSGLLAACGGGYDFTSADVIDSSETQQRWLKYPGSSIVINPAAVSGEDTTDRTKQALSLGIGDSVVDNVLFTLEPASANGVGGSAVWEANFSPDTTTFSNMTEAGFTNNSSGANLNVVVPDAIGETPLDANHPYTIQGNRETFTYDFVNNEYYLVVQTGECADLFDINLYTLSPVVSDELLVSVGANETRVVNINDYCESYDPNLITEATRAFLKINFRTGGAYQATSIAIKTIPSSASVANDVAIEFAPYALKNTATFANGTVVTAQDFFYDVNTVTRALTLDAAGSFVVGGQIAEGATFTYDERNGYIQVNGANGINYCVKLSENDDVSFFATEEDMLNGNPLESSEGAAFWTTLVDSLTVGDTIYFAVSASASETADALAENANNGTSQNRARRRLQDLPAEWDEYIASHGDVPDYIANMPEEA